MRTKHFSFELEETIPALFLAQGWLGGTVAAVVYTAAVCLWDQHISVFESLFICTYFIFVTSFAGVIKSIIMWAPYGLTKVRVRAVTRVVVASIITSLLALNCALLAGYTRREDLIAWVLACFLGGLPTAILVGSRVKPWGLFTFGTLAGERRQSVLGTLGTLPLRFLSLLTLAVSCLYFACEVRKQYEPRCFSLAFGVVATYLLCTAYLTFRSPRKVILSVTGLIANTPVVLVGFIAYLRYSETHIPESLYVTALCATLLLAWIVFLAARLSLRTSSAKFLSNILSHTPLVQIEQRDHDCLGTRFVEWQQRVA